ncbi:MAG: L,D-transpeptidase family protein [Beijerinckiaceae bacterium]
MHFIARFLVLLLFAFIITVMALAVFAPHLLQSLQDKASRTFPRVTEPVLKPKPPISLEQRLSDKGLERGQPVFIRIMKESSELELWMNRGDQWVLLHIYPVCRWSGALGPKLKEGDGQAPEGFYAVTRRALNPQSNYHLSFNLAFPNAYDKAHGRTGSFLMVHGDCLSIGCYAMTDAGIEEIYALVEAGLKAGQTSIPVHVFPFRMTQQNLDRFKNNRWLSYWENLKEGWDLFETSGQPPAVQACGKTYRFGEQGLRDASCRPILGI